MYFTGHVYEMILPLLVDMSIYQECFLIYLVFAIPICNITKYELHQLYYIVFQFHSNICYNELSSVVYIALDMEEYRSYHKSLWQAINYIYFIIESSWFL